MGGHAMMVKFKYCFCSWYLTNLFPARPRAQKRMDRRASRKEKCAQINDWIYG
jgi:hypothetical protein